MIIRIYVIAEEYVWRFVRGYVPSCFQYTLWCALEHSISRFHAHRSIVCTTPHRRNMMSNKKKTVTKSCSSKYLFRSIPFLPKLLMLSFERWNQSEHDFEELRIFVWNMFHFSLMDQGYSASDHGQNIKIAHAFIQ